MKIHRYALFVKKSVKINILTIQNIVKLKIILITQLNVEMLHIVYVIRDIVLVKILP